MAMTVLRRTLACAAAAILPSVFAGAEEAAPENNERPVVGPGYADTPFVSEGSEWRVHDNRRPHPPVITPPGFSTQEAAGTPPSDAVVLFDGTDLSAWRKGDGSPPLWQVENGYMAAGKKAGSIFTKEQFGDCQLHVEWSAPDPPKGDSQGRGNSGVFFFGGNYEIQVLDSYENPTYADGQAAALYGQKPPDVNASRKPGEWQTYDIVFTAPRFKEGGELESPAYATVFHNGVLVHYHVPLLGRTNHKKAPKYVPHGPKGPIQLQDHNNPVRFRNIWVRPLPAPEPAR
jgi:hypothetical protein